MFVNMGSMRLDPKPVYDKMSEFLQALQKRLDVDDRGGKIVYAGPSRAENIASHIDVEIEDKNGKISKFSIDPFNTTWTVVL